MMKRPVFGLKYIQNYIAVVLCKMHPPPLQQKHDALKFKGCLLSNQGTLTSDTMQKAK